MERLFFLIISLLAFNCSYAYKVETHEGFAIETTKAGDINTYLTGYLGVNIDDKYDYAGEPEPLRYFQLIGKGAIREDDETPMARPLNHFYDPNDNSTMTSMSLAGGHPSPDWVLEDGTEVSWDMSNDQPIDTPCCRGQDYSLSDARDYLYAALTETDPATRKYNRRNHFYSLGHVLHIVADMGQPEHVRLDQHLYFDNPKTPFEQVMNSFDWQSQYEEYTNRFQRQIIAHVIDRKNVAGCANPRVPVTYSPPQLAVKTARELLDKENGQGIAEFTNSNFVSNDTNFDSGRYAKPAEGGITSVSIDDLFNKCENNPYTEKFVVGKDYVPIVAGQRMTGNVTFVSSTVTDYTLAANSTMQNDRAASYSIFSQEAVQYQEACSTFTYDPNTDNFVPGCRKYALNRWNFDRAHEFLVPRIIAYGNALLEHLYRGRMEFLPPDQSQVTNILLDPIKKEILQLPLRVANTTPDEAMGTGKLVAVVTYVDRNNEVVEVITSDEITGTPTQTTSQPFTFKFTERAFPLSMEGLTAYIQVIFRGKLGNDEDTIVVARKPLNEIIQPFPLNADLPDSGVYAVIDHSNINNKFNTLKMNLSSPEQIDGTLFPSASYHQDNCFSYYINCNGSYNRTAESFISVSDAFSADAMNLPTTMVFPNGIPPNATDLFINFINFKTDPTQPVGIAFVDISEPTFISFINSTDYTSFESEYKSYQEIEAILTPQSELIPRIRPAATEVEILFGTNSIVSAKIGSLPIAQYSRIAILTDVTKFSLTRNVKRLDVANINPTSKQEWYPATVHQDIMFADGLKYHYFSGVNKLRNVISNINILLEYTPILLLPGKTADTSILPDATLSNEAPVIY